MAMASLYAHRLRSILTLIGIIIGVMTVIVVVAFIQGLNDFIAGEIITLGADVFMVSKASHVIRSVLVMSHGSRAKAPCLIFVLSILLISYVLS